MIQYKKYKTYLLHSDDNIFYVIYTYSKRAIKITLRGKVLIDKEFVHSNIHFRDPFTIAWAYLLIILHDEFLTYSDRPIKGSYEKGAAILTQHGLLVAILKIILLLTLIFGVL